MEVDDPKPRTLARFSLSLHEVPLKVWLDGSFSSAVAVVFGMKLLGMDSAADSQLAGLAWILLTLWSAFVWFRDKPAFEKWFTPLQRLNRLCDEKSAREKKEQELLARRDERMKKFGGR